MNNAIDGELAGVVLAAGIGSRLRPLTKMTPKALCLINGVPLVDLAIDSLEMRDSQVAVNAHHHAAQITAHFHNRAVNVSFEPSLLRSAGAIGNLRPWIDGRPVAIRNADSWILGDLSGFWDGWNGQVPRLLVKDVGGRADFGSLRFLGLSLLPASIAASLPAEPAGLNDLVWRPAFESGRIDLIAYKGAAVDCGTPSDYLNANLISNGGASVIAPDSKVRGLVTESVVLPGGVVGAEERLHRRIRGPHGIDIAVDEPPVS